LPPRPPSPQNKNNEYCAPVTSFDWSWTDPNQIATSSIDTTCTVWDITTRKVKTQLIAHDKEVFDIAWSLNKEIFATAGADGSLRLFDLRSLEHSTIMYETQPNAAGHAVPLLRIAWNRMDNFYIAAVSGDSSRTVIIDVRMPSQPYTELVGQVNPATGVSSGHMAPISAVTWAPHSACHMVTGADDSQALIWDLSQLPKPMEDPILAYTAESEINSLCWSPSAPDWVSISFASKVQILKV
jgi:WD repeat-containing protein 68